MSAGTFSCPVLVAVPLTCLQWFSNTMRQVSGSAVHGLAGAALRPDRPPGPRGFSRLSQLMLAPVGVGQRSRELKKKKKKSKEKKKMMGEKEQGGGRGGGGYSNREREGMEVDCRWVVNARQRR